MDARYRGTVVEEMLPLIGKDAAAVLKSHGACKEQYALWLYKRASNATGIQTAVVLGLCVSVLAGLTKTLLENGGIALNGETLAVLLAMAGICAVILALTAWTMRHTSAVLHQYMRSAAFLHQATADYVSNLTPAAWREIASFEPDLDHFRVHSAVHRKPPALTVAQQRRIACLRPWRTTSGWASVGMLALLFFVGENRLNVISAVAVTTVGIWLALRATQMYLAGQIVDHRSGLTTFGKPARLIALTAIAGSIALVAVGGVGVLLTV